jgi:predicted nucleic acid-binding protein
MILLDTNVLIDLDEKDSPHHSWAVKIVNDALANDGAAVNAIILAELCARDEDAAQVPGDLRALGLEILDLPAAASAICGKAYRRYSIARRNSGPSPAPKIPLPDFFIGAHAEVMGWQIATRDAQRYQAYFPKVGLLTP